MADSGMFLLIHQFGWTEALVIMGFVLLIFGPKKLPEIAEAMGNSIRKFRSATREIKKDIDPNSEVRPPADD